MTGDRELRKSIFGPLSMEAANAPRGTNNNQVPANALRGTNNNQVPANAPRGTNNNQVPANALRGTSKQSHSQGKKKQMNPSDNMGQESDDIIPKFENGEIYRDGTNSFSADIQLWFVERIQPFLGKSLRKYITQDKVTPFLKFKSSTYQPSNHQLVKKLATGITRIENGEEKEVDEENMQMLFIIILIAWGKRTTNRNTYLKQVKERYPSIMALDFGERGVISSAFQMPDSMKASNAKRSLFDDERMTPSKKAMIGRPSMMETQATSSSIAPTQIKTIPVDLQTKEGVEGYLNQLRHMTEMALKHKESMESRQIQIKEGRRIKELEVVDGDSKQSGTIKQQKQMTNTLIRSHNETLDELMAVREQLRTMMEREEKREERLTFLENERNSWKIEKEKNETRMRVLEEKLASLERQLLLPQDDDQY